MACLADAFLVAAILERCHPRVVEAYSRFLGDKEVTTRTLLERAVIKLLVVPDFTKLEKKKARTLSLF